MGPIRKHSTLYSAEILDLWKDSFYANISGHTFLNDILWSLFLYITTHGTGKGIKPENFIFFS